MSTQNNQSVIWLSKNATLPDTCISCGMFADQRVKVKHTCVTVRMVEEKADSVSGLGCLLFLLGPIGTIISIVLTLFSSNQRKSSGETVTVEKRKAFKLKMQVPQCLMCQSERKATPLESNVETGEIAFEAHKKFVQNYQVLNPNASREYSGDPPQPF